MSIIDKLNRMSNCSGVAGNVDYRPICNTLRQHGCGKHVPEEHVASSSIRRRCRQWLPIEGVPVVSLRAEIQVRCTELFCLAEKQISAWLQVQVQALHECG